MRSHISDERASWARLYTKAEENRQELQILGLALSFFYYFISLSPLTRGSAYSGLTLLHGILLGCGFLTTEKLPKGVQLDLEVLLASTPASFVETASPWFSLQKLPDDSVLHPGNLPSVAQSFPTLREVIRGLNMNLGSTAELNDEVEGGQSLEGEEEKKESAPCNLSELNNLEIPSINLLALNSKQNIL